MRRGDRELIAPLKQRSHASQRVAERSHQNNKGVTFIAHGDRIKGSPWTGTEYANMQGASR